MNDADETREPGAPSPDGVPPVDPAASSASDAAAAVHAAGFELNDRQAELEAAVQEANERCLRTQAELENFRKRSRRELDDERRYAALPIVREMLSVLDNLQRGIEAAEKSESGAALLEGVKMVAVQLQSSLQQHACRQIMAAGALFDPHLHEAIGQVPSNDVPAGHVAHVARQGYTLHDRVVRPAQVLVSTGPA